MVATLAEGVVPCRVGIAECYDGMSCHCWVPWLSSCLCMAVPLLGAMFGCHCWVVLWWGAMARCHELLGAVTGCHVEAP